jgi:hypothetical protein
VHCRENVALENIWRQRYERARYVAREGLFAMPANTNANTLLIRQCRARQAQAANAILMHQRSCPVCGSAEQTRGVGFPESRAS